MMPGEHVSFKTHPWVRRGKNRPVLTHVFWHTILVPKNVGMELLRRIWRNIARAASSTQRFSDRNGARINSERTSLIWLIE